MKQYSSFIFESAGFDEQSRSIELKYSLDQEIEFSEHLILPVSVGLAHHKNGDVQRALDALHIIGGISYYKTCLPKKMELRNQQLDKAQADFWTSVYENGLGEFFFKNNIDPKGVVNFSAENRESRIELQENNSQLATRNSKKVLVPIGGGKDSLVTIELLKNAGYEVTLLRIGHHPYIAEMSHVAGLPLITIDRHLDGTLFDLNEQGALNGHVPITAYLHCVTVIIALLTNHEFVAFSNERSADEGNTKMNDFDVNHQWSKGAAFEKAFNEYVHTYISPNVTVFSMLRPLSELQIAQELVQHDRYLPLFTSCNRNWHIKKKQTMGTRWCTECPKCAFAFVLFAPFLNSDEMKQIFNHNLFEDEALLPLFRELLGISGHKPFECVGTAREVAAGFLLAHKKKKYDDTAAMKMFIAEALPNIKNPKEVIEESFTIASLETLPEQFKPIIQSL